MDDFNGKFCNMGSYPLIKNSMSLLMDYMPEYYSSSQIPKKSKKPRRLNQQQPNKTSKIFYILKDDQINAIEPNSDKNEKKYKTINNNELDEVNRAELNRIRTDLSSLLIQHPSKFASFNLPETFNCTNKQRGFHRDPFNCKLTDYFYISTKSSNLIKNIIIRC